MSTAIRIDDLAAPRLGAAQRAALAYGATVTVDFHEAAILEAARQRTGLADFGPDDFRERLGLLSDEWGGDAGLTGYQRMVLHAYLVRYASNRLLIQAALSRHPEILAERIDRPLIVVGLPRSGTTHLVNLLASDQRLHSLPLWEAYEPLPLPGEPAPGDASDPRFARCAAAWAGMQQVVPLIAAMHPMNPEHIHEELELMGPDFASYNFEWLSHSPRWRDHYYATDQTPHYRYLKNVLRLLQWRRGGARRWLLKCPQHLEQLPVLLDVFPDATLVFTHRDPLAVLQSTVTMQAYTQRMNRRQVALGALLEYWADRIGHLVSAGLRDRALAPAERSLDLPFQRFMADPLDALERVYRMAGLELTAPVRVQLERYLAAHPRGRDGRIVYELRQDFAVDPAVLRRRYAGYCERFAVAPEVR